MSKLSETTLLDRARELLVNSTSNSMDPEVREQWKRDRDDLLRDLEAR